MLLNAYMHIGVLAKLGDQAPHLVTVLAGRFAYFPISCHFFSELKTNSSYRFMYFKTSFTIVILK